MSRSDQIIVAKGLTRTYSDSAGNELHALRGVDLTVREGELVAIVGPSGSGKSTLLQLIGGLDRATTGTISFADRDVSTLTEKQRTDFRRDHIGFVFQSFHLVPTMSVIENIALTAIVANKRRSDWHSHALDILVELDLIDHADRMPHLLSGGQRQRVALGRAVFGRPDALLADEPTGNLDTRNSDIVLSLIREGIDASEGRCGVLVTHDFRAAGVADRVIALRDGVVVDELRHESRSAGRSDVERGEHVRSWLATALR
jgi:ABC-type lipoprotein export system ATPase subunit